MVQHEIVQGAGVVEVIHGISNEYLVIHRLGDVPTDQTFGVTELVLQQKNEGIQVLAGVAVNIELSAAGSEAEGPYRSESQALLGAGSAAETPL